MSITALMDASHYSSTDTFLVSARAIEDVDHLYSTIERLTSSSQMQAQLEPMNNEPDHLSQLFEEQGQEVDPAEHNPLYVDSSDIEQADNTENAVDNAVRLYELFKFGLHNPHVPEHDTLFVHQSEVDQAEEAEDGEHLGQLESPEARHWWATPTLEELTIHYLGPSTSHVSGPLPTVLILALLNVSLFREECSTNVPYPLTVHADLCLEPMKMGM